MDKKGIGYVLLDAVFLVIFNVIFFVLCGTEHPASVWLSYWFIHFAYAAVLVTPLLTHKSSRAFVYGQVAYSVSTTYFIVELVVGVFFIFLRMDTIKAALAVQLIIFVIYAVLLRANLVADDQTAAAVERKDAEIAYIRGAAFRVKALLERSDDKQMTRTLERVYDTIHSSPTRSSPAVQALEQQVVHKVAALETAVRAKQMDRVSTLSGEIIELMDSRNRRLKMSQ